MRKRTRAVDDDDDVDDDDPHVSRVAVGAAGWREERRGAPTLMDKIAIVPESREERGACLLSLAQNKTL